MTSFLGLGFGIRFYPTDEELITYYLKNIVENRPLPSGWDKVMIKREIYGEKGTPWILFCKDDPWQTPVEPLGKPLVDQKVIYVFTRLSNVGKKTGDKNKNRTAGCGQWHGNTAGEDITKDGGKGELIGKKRTFTFKSKEETQGQWTMHEYYLEGASLEGLNPEDTSLVLCRIKRDDSKSSKGGKLISHKSSRYGTVESSDPAANGSAKRKSDIDQLGSTKKLRIDATDSSYVQGTMISNAGAIDSSVSSGSVVVGTSTPPAPSNMNDEEPDIASSSGTVVDAALGDNVYETSIYADILPVEEDPNGWISIDELDRILVNNSSAMEGEQINGPIQQIATSVTSATNLSQDESLSASAVPSCLMGDTCMLDEERNGMMLQSTRSGMDCGSKKMDQTQIIHIEDESMSGNDTEDFWATNQEATIAGVDDAPGAGDGYFNCDPNLALGDDLYLFSLDDDLDDRWD